MSCVQEQKEMEEPITEAIPVKETGRLAAFRDGVFAIAITLLVLELKVPDLGVASASPAQLGKARYSFDGPEFSSSCQALLLVGGD